MTNEFNFYALHSLFILNLLFLKNLCIIAVLASWFRLKYPHLTVGALASAAPILYFDKITPQNGYYSVVTRDYRVIYHNFVFSSFIYLLFMKL